MENSSDEVARTVVLLVRLLRLLVLIGAGIFALYGFGFFWEKLWPIDVIPSICYTVGVVQFRS
jgi:hypothetical protein